MNYQSFIVDRTTAHKVHRIAEKQHKYCAAIRSPYEGDFPVRFTVDGEKSAVICEKIEDNRMKITVFGEFPGWL